MSIEVKEVLKSAEYYTNCNIKFNISKELNDKCIKFAEDSVQSSAECYARRNQNDIEKIKKDIRVRENF